MGTRGRPVGRRVVLTVALGLPAAGAVLTGCRFTDPVIRSDRHNTGVSPTPEPTPDPDQLAAAELESELSSHLAWLATSAGTAPAVKRWAAAAGRAHLLAAQVLGQLDPFSLPPAAPAPARAIAQPSVAAALASVKTLSVELAATHRARALTAVDPAMALLWTSLMVTATSQAAPTAALLDRPTRPHVADPGTAAEADQVLLERLHAAIQGYENGVAQIAFRDPRRVAAESRLMALVRLRDLHAAAVREAGGDPPGPRPGYQQPVRPGTADQALSLFVLLERTVLDAMARRVPARAGAAREQALTDLLGQVPHCQAWGGAIVLWPGWP